MTHYPLDRLLTAFAGRLHAFSVCSIQDGWRLCFPGFDAVTIHFVLQGSGCVRIGNGDWQPFGSRSVIVVPPLQGHALGYVGADTRESPGGEHCKPFGDGLVAFTAGDGRQDILMVCGSLARQDGHALGLIDLLAGEPVMDLAGSIPARPAFDLMLAEVTQPDLGTQAMAEALMQQCLILLLRQRLRQGETPFPLVTPGDRRLTRAVIAILANPAAPHSVESLAMAAGMGRTAFAEAFSRAFGQGPIDFVQKARLRAAARLLTTTDLPVKVVAISVGYASRSHFSRAFVATYNTDPTSYRQQGQGD
ncbi:helix-turn-helix domain-containing protein [Pseudoroseomonas globiformis]|uniref:Helix-turn-helix domain-containing protein n=1 Tax=Teichococcus globiformis TaxID=2307229 RepID=A0ABV7FWU5_9PROT